MLYNTRQLLECRIFSSGCCQRLRSHLAGKKGEFRRVTKEPLLSRLVQLPKSRLPNGLVEVQNERLLHPGNEPSSKISGVCVAKVGMKGLGRGLDCVVGTTIVSHDVS